MLKELLKKYTSLEKDVSKINQEICEAKNRIIKEIDLEKADIDFTIGDIKKLKEYIAHYDYYNRERCYTYEIDGDYVKIYSKIIKFINNN